MMLLIDQPVSTRGSKSSPLIFEESLSRTLDAVEEAMFESRAIEHGDRERVARWIGSRPPGYAHMPGPTEHDYCEGVRLFTGETITSKAGIAHILGEEACRLLLLLDVKAPAVRAALRRSAEGMLERLAEHERGGRPRGLYCCGRCSVALWRHLAAGGLREAGDLIPSALRALRHHRAGRGRWRSFPFHYTVLGLTEMCHPLALTELRYARPMLERLLRSSDRGDKYHARRVAVAERALTIC
jgi:hypothetical protein